MAVNKSGNINTKARNAMFFVAVLNILTALMFWIAYSSSQETGFLIAVFVNVASAIVIVILANTLMKKGKPDGR